MCKFNHCKKYFHTTNYKFVCSIAKIITTTIEYEGENVWSITTIITRALAILKPSPRFGSANSRISDTFCSTYEGCVFPYTPKIYQYNVIISDCKTWWTLYPVLRCMMMMMVIHLLYINIFVLKMHIGWFRSVDRKRWKAVQLTRNCVLTSSKYAKTMCLIHSLCV